MPALSANIVIRKTRDSVWIDVSTPTHPGAVAVIDLADLARVIDGRGRWCAAKMKPDNPRLYVVRGRPRKVLHRVLLGLRSPRVQGDHKNRNTLDNRQRNLRKASNRNNSRNRCRRRNGTSKFKGVSWDKSRRMWITSIGHKSGKGRQHLGRYRNEKEAARVYDREALRRYGTFAFQNFPRNKNGK